MKTVREEIVEAMSVDGEYHGKWLEVTTSDMGWWFAELHLMELFEDSPVSLDRAKVLDLIQLRVGEYDNRLKGSGLGT